MNVVELQRRRAEAAVKSLNTLPALPGTAVRLLAELGPSGSDARRLAALVNQDMGLAAKVLRVANSPFYGQSRSIDSVERALVLLGLDVVRNIAVASSLDPLFRGGQIGPGFHMRELWRHSLAVALLADSIAHQFVPEARPQAFIAGLLHDIGILVAVHVLPNEFLQLVGDAAQYVDADRTLLAELELRHLGATHDELGAALLQHWLIPEPLLRAAANHHHPSSDAGCAASGAAWREDPLIALVALADRLSTAVGQPISLDGRPPTRLAEACAGLGLEDAALTNLVALEQGRIEALAAQLSG